MKVIIFGGSFNPPTLAHEAIIAECLALSGFDQVWVMPSGSRSDKQIATSVKHRLAMLALVKKQRFANNPHLVISDFELKLPEPTITATTVAALQKAFPATEFWYVFGNDAYQAMPTWPNGEALQKKLKIVIAGNTGTPTIQLPTHLADVSSTRVRAGDLTGLVSPGVARYITTHKLYGSY